MDCEKVHKNVAVAACRLSVIKTSKTEKKLMRILFFNFILNKQLKSIKLITFYNLKKIPFPQKKTQTDDIISTDLLESSLYIN